jgi:hypothetical protein
MPGCSAHIVSPELFGAVPVLSLGSARPPQKGERGETFKKTFDDLMTSMPHAENLDSMASLAGRRRADWLTHKRRVVVETKELEENQFAELAALARTYALEIGWIQEIIRVPELIRAHPRGAELSATLTDINTKVLRDGIQSANGQIRATKDALDLPLAIAQCRRRATSSITSSRRVTTARPRTSTRAMLRCRSSRAAATKW